MLRNFITTTFPEIVAKPYEGTRDDRLNIRTMTSSFIRRYMDSLYFVERGGKVELAIDDKMRLEVLILKQIARDYIIASPSLGAQQLGQRRILQELYDDIHEEMHGRRYRYLPKRFWHLAQDRASAARRTADCIVSMTEAEAVGLHSRFRGYSAGSVLDPIVR
jgi:dGTPase